MKKEYYQKWVKMPERGTDEWEALMGVVMKNVNGALANLMLVNPTFEGFSFYHRKILGDLKAKAGSGPIQFHKYLEDTYPHRSATAIGLGVFLKELQPYMVPFVKIAKAKIGKEFRHYLILSRSKYRTRKRESNLSSLSSRITCRTSYGSNGTLIPTIAIDCKEHHVTFMGRFDREINSLYRSQIIICRTREGKAVLGVSDYYNSRFDSKNGLILPTAKTICIKLSDVRPNGNGLNDYINEVEHVVPTSVLEAERQERDRLSKVKKRV